MAKNKVFSKALCVDASLPSIGKKASDPFVIQRRNQDKMHILNNIEMCWLGSKDFFSIACGALIKIFKVKKEARHFSFNSLEDFFCAVPNLA